MKPLELDNLSVTLGGRPAVSAVSLEVASGEVVGVLGPNGGGKTTLLRAALGLAPACGGVARLGGADVRGLGEADRSARAAYLPQARQLAWNLPAWRVVALGKPDRPPRLVKPAALAVLERLGMTALSGRGVLDMSGGERAKVLLGRLLLTGAPLLVADEPAAGLDPDAQFQVMDLLRERARAGAAVVVSLHDLTLAARGCDRIALLAGGRLAAQGTPQACLTSEALMSAYGLEGALLASPFGPVLAARRPPPQ